MAFKLHQPAILDIAHHGVAGHTLPASGGDRLAFDAGLRVEVAPAICECYVAGKGVRLVC